jgi:hypothetical protein
VNAGPKKPLRATDAVDSAAKSTCKLNDILWRTISQRVFSFGPYKLIRIELWGIGWKSMHMEPLVLANELLNDEAPVDRAAIPKQHHRSAQVPEEVTQEADDLHPRNVGAVETEVKSKPLARWRDGDGGDGRNPLPAVAVSKDRGMADRRPGLAHVRNEKESAFVEEYEMGPKSSGFFLTRATAFSSTVRWLARFSAWPGAPASATSIVDPSSLATHARSDRESRNVSRSAWQFAARSRVLSCTPPRQHLAPTVARAAAFATWTTVAGARALVWAAGLRPHLGESPGPNAPPSLSKRSASRPQTGTFCQLAAKLWPAVFGFLAVEGFHGVACPIA